MGLLLIDIVCAVCFGRFLSVDIAWRAFILQNQGPFLSARSQPCDYRYEEKSFQHRGFLCGEIAHNFCDVVLSR